jgi:hypothetical protein
MGEACSTYWGDVYTGLWWGNLKERVHLGDQSAGGTIILIWIFRKWDSWVMDWIELAQIRVK